MPGPVTYFDWISGLERFAKGDDTVLSELEQGSFVISEGTVFRFYNKIQEAYIERKKYWIDKFNRLLQVNYLKREDDIVFVLQYAKSNLQPISKFIKLKVFPDDLRDTLEKDFKSFVTETKNNIKKTLTKNQPRNEKIPIIINKFDFIETTLETKISKNDPIESSSKITANKRSILFKHGTQN